MIQNVIFGILFSKIIFRAYSFFTFVQAFQCTSSEFHFNFRYSSRKSQSQQKLAITYWSLILWYSFAKRTSLILWTSTRLTLKIICSRNAAKNLSDFKNFSADMFLVGVRKNICIASFIDSQELHSWSTLKANVFIFLYISVRKFFSKDVVRFYLMGMGWGKAE